MLEHRVDTPLCSMRAPLYVSFKSRHGPPSNTNPLLLVPGQMLKFVGEVALMDYTYKKPMFEGCFDMNPLMLMSEIGKI